MRDLVRARAARGRDSARASPASERLHAQARSYLSAQEGLDDAVTCDGCRSRSSIIPPIRSPCRRWSRRFGLSKERVERLERTIEEFVPNLVARPDGAGASGAAWRRSDRGRDFRHRDRRLRALRKPAPAHGLSWPCTQRALDRGHGSARWHHEGREWARAPHAGRKRLDLSASAADRQDEALPAGAASPPRVREIAWKAQTRLTARYRALSGRGQEDNGRLHRNRSRARRLHVVRRPGGADRLNASGDRLLAHRRGRDHGRGTARQTLCGRPRADARRKIGTAPDALSEMR